MKFRIVEVKNKEGFIRYKIQYKYLCLWWRDYKTPSISFYKHYKYYRSLYYSAYEFYSVEEAEKELNRFLTEYEYKGIPIYPAHFDKFYVLNWGYKEIFDIFGSYEECCNGIDRELALIEEERKRYNEKKAKEAMQKEYKKHKNVIKSINK